MSKAKRLPIARTQRKTIGDLLEEICQRTDPSCLLIACCTREYFLSQIAEHGALNRGSSLLVATLRQMSASEKTQVAFCPDIQIFRAYLTALPYSDLHRSVEHVVVLDMLVLHYATSDFTVQGLSRTFAVLASTNGTLRGNMELVECSNSGEVGSASEGSMRWNEQVPLLSGSIKIGEAGQGWASLKTSIKSFAQRWIEFDDMND